MIQIKLIIGMALVLAWSFAVVFAYAQAQSTVSCAPGDIPIDANGKPVADSGQAINGCLYGSQFSQGLGGTITDPRNNIRALLNIILGFFAIVVVMMVIYGGALWLTAGGSEDKVTKGKHTLIWAAIGALVISLAWTISSYVLQLSQRIAN